MKEPMKVNGGLALTAVATGALLIPLFGWLPMIAIGTAVGASYLLVNQVRPK